MLPFKDHVTGSVGLAAFIHQYTYKNENDYFGEEVTSVLTQRLITIFKTDQKLIGVFKNVLF